MTIEDIRIELYKAINDKMNNKYKTTLIKYKI